MSSTKALLFLLLPCYAQAWGSDQPDCLEVGSSAFMGMGLGFGTGFLKSKGASTFSGSVAGQPVNTTSNYYFLNAIPSAGASMTGFLFNPQLGWNCRLRNTRIVFGVIGGGAISTMSTSVAYPSVQVSKDAGNVSTIYGNVEYIKVSDAGWFDLGFRFGVVAGSALIFARIGWAIHSLRAKLGVVGTGPGSSSKWSNALLTGIGVDFNLTPNVILGAEADVHITSQPSFSFNLGSYSASVRTRNVVLALFATVKYAFPSAVQQ